MTKTLQTYLTKLNYLPPRKWEGNIIF